MFANLSGWHFLIILAIILLLFGAPKLPGLAKSIGQSLNIFRNEVKTPKGENKDSAGDDVDAPTSGSGTTPPRNG